MDRKCHHVIRSIGRTFTFKEWADYLQNERPEDDIVFVSDDGYKFNIFDMCLNPDVAIDFRLNMTYYIKITVAKSTNGRWDYGMTYSYGTGGGGFGCSFVSDIDKGFATKNLAVIDGLKRAIRMAEKQETSKSIKRFIEEVKSRIKELEHPSPIQLSLFDN